MDQAPTNRDRKIARKNKFNEALERQHTEFQSSKDDIQSTLVNVDSAFDMVLDDPKAFGAPNTTCSNADRVSCLSKNCLHADIAIHK